MPEAARLEAVRQLLTSQTPSLIEENRRIHRLLTDGLSVEYRAPDGRITSTKVWFIDLSEPDANDWLVVNQFTVVEAGQNRRADVVLFVNGLPPAVLELKNAAAENASTAGAFNQLGTYKKRIPSLFRTNAALVVSDGIEARIGSLTADFERFMPWRTATGEDFAHRGTPELDTLLRGVFDRQRFLELLRDFTVFGDSGSGPFKILAGYHQAGRMATARSALSGTRKVPARAC